MLTVACDMVRGALAIVRWLAAKVAVQFEAGPVCHKFRHVEMGQKLLAAAVCGRIVDHIEKASGVSAKATHKQTYRSVQSGACLTRNSV